MKSIFNKGKAGTGKDTRAHGRWLFAAVLVGNKKRCYTHGNGLKRFTFTILPKPALAKDGKSRGTASMKMALTKCISKKAFAVHDAWKASSAAIAQLGYKSAPPVNHSAGWRDPKTGFHSNDIESEFSRLKGKVRERYGRLCFQATASSSSDDAVEDGDLYEYAYRVNIGDGFNDILKALIMASPANQ